MILIEPYSDRWPGQFAEIAARLRSLLGDRAVRIDHIGSTAVPGLAAKPVIDVQVAVRHLGDAQPLVDAGLEEIAVPGDHRPPGAGGPDADWDKRLFSVRGAISANVHVRVDGRANQRYALLFRDYLRSSRCGGRLRGAEAAPRAGAQRPRRVHARQGSRLRPDRDRGGGVGGRDRLGAGPERRLTRVDHGAAGP
jgi:GrpB-like predicted nucleotidyltransferase (UPF0157 family)